MGTMTSTPVGTTFPSGEVLIHPWQDAILRSAICAPPRDGGEPHPLWALSGALRGLGTDVDGILALVGARTEEGPMVASCVLDYVRPFEFGVTYEVTGRIVGFERKVGRRTGPFDLFTFELEMGVAGETVSRVTFVWVLPRRGE
jgi:hypothetical protein